jgi:hypothetical protein
MTVGKHHWQIAIQKRRVTLIGVIASQPLCDCQRAFREYFIYQKAWPGQGRESLDHWHRCIEPVTGKAGATTYERM